MSATPVQISVYRTIPKDFPVFVQASSLMARLVRNII